MADKKVSRTMPPTGAHECSYSGMVFRSWLEARWALIFDILGWDYDYEPAKYRVTKHMAYIPDFFVYGPLNCWVEVKGAIYLSRESIAKIGAAVAGPYRLPSRAEPFAPPGRLLIGGAISEPKITKKCVFSLVVPSGEKYRANIMPVSLDPVKGLLPAGQAWMSIDASGRPAAKRPKEQVARQICEPAPVPGTDLGVVQFALKAAYNMRFDKKGYALIPTQVEKVVSGRWAGRPVAVR